jgi:hypothetical protein
VFRQSKLCTYYEIIFKIWTIFENCHENIICILDDN